MATFAQKNAEFNESDLLIAPGEYEMEIKRATQGPSKKNAERHLVTLVLSFVDHQHLWSYSHFPEVVCQLVGFSIQLAVCQFLVF